MAYAAIAAVPATLLFYFAGNLVSGTSHTHDLDAPPETPTPVTAQHAGVLPAQHAVLPISDGIKVKTQATDDN